MDTEIPMEAGTCLYEDAELFVLYKPSGMLVHRGWGRAEEVLVDFARPRTLAGSAHPIQRLDRGASGPVLFAKTPEVAAQLSDIAHGGGCQKFYLALVRGECRESLDIDYPISRREDGPKVDARTRVRRLAIAETTPRHCSLVLAAPLTGRLHQIRRHLKHENYPLFGDGRYGRGDLNRAFAVSYGLERLALHAYHWRVQNPRTKDIVSGTVRIPPDLAQPLLKMGFALEPLARVIESHVEELARGDAYVPIG